MHAQSRIKNCLKSLRKPRSLARRRQYEVQPATTQNSLSEEIRAQKEPYFCVTKDEDGRLWIAMRIMPIGGPSGSSSESAIVYFDQEHVQSDCSDRASPHRRGVVPEDADGCAERALRLVFRQMVEIARRLQRPWQRSVRVAERYSSPRLRIAPFTLAEEFPESRSRNAISPTTLPANAAMKIYCSSTDDGPTQKGRQSNYTESEVRNASETMSDSDRWSIALKNGGVVAAYAAIPIVARLKAMSFQPEMHPWLRALREHFDGTSQPDDLLEEICRTSLRVTVAEFRAKSETYRDIVLSGVVDDGRTLRFQNPFTPEGSKKLKGIVAGLSAIVEGTSPSDSDGRHPKGA